MTYAKCDTKDTLYDDRNNTYATVLETLEMSVIDVYLVRIVSTSIAAIMIQILGCLLYSYQPGSS